MFYLKAKMLEIILKKICYLTSRLAKTYGHPTKKKKHPLLFADHSRHSIFEGLGKKGSITQ